MSNIGRAMRVGTNNEHESLTISVPKPHNPYDDPTLTTSVPENVVLDHRDPFNDVVKHGDIIAHYRRNRTLSDYPRRMRPIVRASATVLVVLFVASLIWDFLR